MTQQITSFARESSHAKAPRIGNFEQMPEYFARRVPPSQREGRPIMKTMAERPFDPKLFLAKVAGGRTITKYQKDQIVFSQGDDADSVFYIRSGKVKANVISEHGKEAVVAILNGGNFFGEGCLAGQPQRMVTVSAMSESTIVRIAKAAIIQVLHDEPTFSEMFISHLLARNIRIEEDLIDQLFNSSERRLARALLLLANFGKDAGSESITPRISHEMLAEMIGTTRARVSFFMNRFRKQGFVSYKGKRLDVHRSLLRVVLTDHLHASK